MKLNKAFFLSDLHLAHENILTFGDRDFKSIQEHDEYIIRKWNETVGYDDNAFILGDIAFKSRYDYLARLNGNLHIILGNHEYLTKLPLIQKYAPKAKVGGCLILGDFIISHIPVHPSQLEHRADYNIHGHLHKNVIDDPRYINVCCERLDYTPTRLEDLLR